MRVLLVHPGASYATAEVCTGLASGLPEAAQALAVDLTLETYALDRRIALAGSWLRQLWRRYGRRAGLPRPLPGDVLYWAANEVTLRAARFLPDWLLVVSGMYVHGDFWVLWRRLAPALGWRIALVLTESPYDDVPQARVLPYVDLAWTNERKSAGWLSAATGMPVGYLPAAYDPAVHTPMPSEHDREVPAHDVVFVGTGFEERCRFLAAVDWDDLGIDLGLYGEWSLLPRRLKRFAHGPVDNRVAAALYRRANVVLNLHRTSREFRRGATQIVAGEAESANPRLYELAGCGACVATDARREVVEKLGSDFPTFSTPEELTQLLRRLLHAPDAAVVRARLTARLVAAFGGPANTWAARARTVLAALAAPASAGSGGASGGDGSSRDSGQGHEQGREADEMVASR